jgi:hypothetical protein
MRNPNGFIRPGYDPLQVADAPTAVTPTPGNTVASVDFTTPSNVGGAAVSEYYAVVNPGNITATSVTPPVAVSGLTNGTEYTTKVWANNSYGPSPYSAESSGFTPVPPYVEDVFSTYLYSGNGSTQTITNGIDLSGEGGLVWIKNRSQSLTHALFDTERGIHELLATNTTVGNDNKNTSVTAFNANGFTLGSAYEVNESSALNKYASWTFRKQPKFFDVVTYTGDGTDDRLINHSLEVSPGMIFIKKTSGAVQDWWVKHRSLAADGNLTLNATTAAETKWDWSPTTTTFSLGVEGWGANFNAQTYVAYLFAHDAGGFGDDGEQNIISCGSFTASGGTASVTLGFEPQLLMFKRSDGSGNWAIYDDMRGMPNGSNKYYLAPNSSGSETSFGNTDPFEVNATGFEVDNSYALPGGSNGAETYIYIAIRRGPMKTPEAGTEVFAPTIGVASTPSFVGNFPVDFCIAGARGSTDKWWEVDRLRGPQRLNSASTADESSATYVSFDNMIGCMTNSFSAYMGYVFRRAPGFFDVVCYTGTGGARTIAHNLQAVPQLILVKQRTASPAASPFTVYSATLGNTGVLFLNSDGGNQGPDNQWNSTTPTSSVFSLGSNLEVNYSGSTFVAYLFATLAGVSKVGSYTGTGADLNVDCGFTSGARFVLIKRSGTGDWYVWDSARGIVSGNDPYLFLNSTAAEEPNTDYIDPLASGFTVTSSAPAALNASGGTYIFLAIA